MRTILPALLLAAAIPTAGQTLDYHTLCGGTESTDYNNDFCALWARGNHQGMRNALSIAIRTARAAENRNRYYFDHKGGAERGAFIQLKRPWMGDDWKVLRHEWHPSNGLREIAFTVFNRDRGFSMGVGLHESFLTIMDDGWPVEVGYEFLAIGSYVLRDGDYPSDFVRRIVECKLDEYGWEIGEVDVRPDCAGIEE